MTREFENAVVAHAAGLRASGDAAHRVISALDFDAAQDEITGWGGYASTPLVHLPALAKELSIADVVYKDEGPRFGLGSFKALGGSYAALQVMRREISKSIGHEVSSADVRTGRYADEAAKITLISATDGNHGRSVAWGAQRFGARCRIYIHAEVSPNRAQAMADLGAEVIRIDGDYDATVAVTRKHAEDNGWFIVSDTSWDGYTDPPRDVMAGYGVMTREICEAMAQPPTHVLLQGGVGGLAASVAAAFRQYWGAESPRVIVVEPDLAACLFASAKAGTSTAVQVASETIMAGLSCGEPSALAWPILAEEVSDFITIPESVVAPAVRRLARPAGDDPSLYVGESAIAGLAGLICATAQSGLRERLALTDQSRVLLIGSEGVTDPDIHARIMAGENFND